MTNQPESFEDWQKNYSEEEKGVAELRYGTRKILKSAAKPDNGKIGRWVQLIFAALALNSCVSQMIVGVKWFAISPALAVIILGKELFGLFLDLKPGIVILLKKPDCNIHEGLFDPFEKKYGAFNFLKVPVNIKYLITSLSYIAASLSNARMIFASAICCRYNVTPCLLNSDILCQKLGNIAILVLDLVKKTKDENPELNIYLFFGLFINVALLCLSLWNQSKVLLNIYDWISDISEGRLLPNEIKAGMSYLYSVNMGQAATEKFIRSSLGVSVRPIIDEDDKKKLEGKKADEQKKDDVKKNSDKKKDEGKLKGE